jgi:hypothetical protein
MMLRLIAYVTGHAQALYADAGPGESSLSSTSRADQDDLSTANRALGAGRWTDRLTASGESTRSKAPVPEGQSLVSPPPIGLPRSALGVALLQHAALVPGPHHILTDWNGRKKDKLSVHVLASAAVEIELCI